jgi:hypothetical protein
LGIFFMAVMKQILGHQFTFGGETHSGWLPDGATTPLATPAYDVALDIDIRSEAGGYLLYWLSRDRQFGGDLWYQTLVDAGQAATQNFGVATDQWQTIE